MRIHTRLFLYKAELTLFLVLNAWYIRFTAFLFVGRYSLIRLRDVNNISGTSLGIIHGYFPLIQSVHLNLSCKLLANNFKRQVINQDRYKLNHFGKGKCGFH